MSGRILINYRRVDSLGSAGRIYDRLAEHFSHKQVFMDVDAIEPGADFVEVIERAVTDCDAFVAVIGSDWVTVTDDEGQRRLDNPDDFVRLEIAAALKRGIRVIPVLVEGAAMPRSIDLPDELKPLVRRNAIEISHTRFNIDAERLIRAIERVFEQMDDKRKAAGEAEGVAAEKAKRIPKTDTDPKNIIDTEQRQPSDGEAEAIGSLVVRQGSQVGRIYSLYAGVNVIGREEGQVIVLDDTLISLRHAQIFAQAGQFALQDLGSTNGTYANGERITASYSLKEGDSVGVGNTLLVFRPKALNEHDKASQVAVPESSSVWWIKIPNWAKIGCGGVALIVVIALACWGCNALLRYFAEFVPVASTVVGQLATDTALPTTATQTALPMATKIPPPTDTALPSPTITPTETLAVLLDLITDDYGVPMALVPAGSIELGLDSDIALAECVKFFGGDCPDWYTDEAPAHTVTLDNFYIDQYEVTNVRYFDCVNAGECDPPLEYGSNTRDSYYGDTLYDDFPVIHVSWVSANTYCEWRGARLPTEDEWEKAARGGLEGKLYPWGDDEVDGSRANFCDINCSFDWAHSDFNDGYEDTAPVGYFPPNDYSLYDMAGNVWEWVADWFECPDDGLADGDNFEETCRMLRGGCWVDGGYGLRVASRSHIFVPSFIAHDFGFRCARSP